MSERNIIKSKDGFPREIAPGIWWLGGCFPMKANDGRGYDTMGASEIHSHVACFMVVGTEKALMFDTGTPANWPEVNSYLDMILGDRQLDWIIPSHWEVPHAGNMEKLFRKYPNSQAGGDLRDFHLAYPYHQDRLHVHKPYDTIDLGGGYKFTMLPAPIKDLTNTFWGFEEREKVMFTSDGFSYTHHTVPEGTEDVHVHAAGECSLMSHEIGVYPTVTQALFLTKAALYWTRLTPIEPSFAAMAGLVERYEPKFICPAHGNVISDVEKMLPVIRQAHEIAYAEGSKEAAAG